MLNKQIEEIEISKREYAEIAKPPEKKVDLQALLDDDKEWEQKNKKRKAQKQRKKQKKK